MSDDELEADRTNEGSGSIRGDVEFDGEGRESGDEDVEAGGTGIADEAIKDEKCREG